MLDYERILQLHSQDYSQRHIAQTGICSRTKVSETIVAAETYGVHWPLEQDISNHDLKEILFPTQEKTVKCSLYSPISPTSTKNWLAPA